MKALTLLVVLALHTTGLWPHLSEAHQARLSSSASGLAAPSTTSAQPAQVALPPLPVPTSTNQLTLDAAGALAIDRATATVLYAQNPTAKRPIASVTKLITALTILSRHRPNETVTIPKLPDYPTEAETIGLVPGDTFRLIDLIEAALVPSANDAADALAIADAGSVTKFAARANTKLAEWGIDGVRLSSASGLTDTDNYATATALAKIASLALTNSTIATTAGHTNGSITSGQGRTYTFTSTNQLLASGKFYGIKTGYTQAAGECFVGLTRINGHEVITVVLGSNDRFGTTTTLTNWISRNWQWL